MKKISILFVLMGMLMPLSAQTATETKGKGLRISPEEFLYIYEKNNQETAADPKSMEEYLDMFINFKLKVAEAQSEGIDTTEAFHKELAGYRAQAAQKYLQDNDAIDSLVEMSYRRMCRMRRARHIVIACPQNATDSVREEAEKKIAHLKSIATPANFAALAREYSEDPSAKKNDGELGWVIPFRYVYSFEDAIYNTPIGSITNIFRSPFGLHIGLVEEEETTKEVHAAHIMKMVKKGDEASNERAKFLIDSIADLIKNGENFEEAALQLSDDRGTSVKGGDLGWFSKGMMVPEFEQTVFSMDKGQMSEPFRTQFGWHIIYLYDKRDIQPLDSIRATVLRQVQRDQRIEEADRSFIRKTRAEYKLSDSMTDEEVRAYADAHLEDKYEDFRHLVQEYHDGILLFEISLRRVWDKAGKDTVGLKRYFASHRNDYRWNEPRFKGYVVYAKTEQAAKRAQTIIRSADADSVKSYIDHRINNDSVTLVRVEHGLWKKGQNPAIDKEGFRIKSTEYKPSEAYPVVKAVGKVLKNPEEYTDERSRVTSDYQDMLEQRWVKELRRKYNIQVNSSLLEQLQAK
ncbi:MAG: peptidylprolyl isomerase [Paludibacteraceae bacterium]|nr:peptidylprolyl isomerase [Paludibacteraceae bacterium]